MTQGTQIGRMERPMQTAMNTTSDTASKSQTSSNMNQPRGISATPSACEQVFEALETRNMPAFIGYMPFGFPDTKTSIGALETMVANGVDIVEIGLPYSDPVMDGPLIQRASHIAIANGERLENVFDAVEAVADAGAVPLIMSYWNRIFHYGVNRFAHDFSNAGGQGLITPDLIPEEAGEWIEASERHGLDRVFLVSPDSSDERLRVVSRNTRGFVYAASRMGVTGEQRIISDSPQTLVRRTREAGAKRVCVGLGVSTPEQGAAVGSYADGVIVGSALVHAMLDATGNNLRDPSEGLSMLERVTMSLADGIHHARR